VEANLDTVLIERLRASGQRVTMPRVMVHRFVASAPRHVTADDVHGALPTLSPATIYSTLELLEDLELVQRVSTLGGVAVYDSRLDPHDHALCRVCGRVFDIPAAAAHPAVAPAGFEVEQTRVQLVGTCADCRSRA
jgi:Fe2+ or Zn2+ uptake regulation protein